jgi:hypothetical protein
MMIVPALTLRRWHSKRSRYQEPRLMRCCNAISASSCMPRLCMMMPKKNAMRVPSGSAATAARSTGRSYCARHFQIQI